MQNVGLHVIISDTFEVGKKVLAISVNLIFDIDFPPNSCDQNPVEVLVLSLTTRRDCDKTFKAGNIYDYYNLT